MRKIIHIDMDCFFAAVEMRDHPEYKDIPLAVGGRPGRRGVLCTSNYHARKFGVKAAQASAYAMKLCPQLIIVPPSMEKYKEASQIIREIFFEYTDLVEPLSLDEAYLDVSKSKNCGGSATLMAKEIQRKIFKRTSLTASAGVSVNKFLAKMASDWRKPNGIFVLAPNDIKNFMPSLAVGKIPGVGKVTEEKLKGIGIQTCADLQKKDANTLFLQLGKFGRVLYSYAYGVDTREVITHSKRKSLSVEHTFEADIENLQGCLDVLTPLSVELLGRLGRLKKSTLENSEISKIFIKLKFSDFKTVTIEKSKGSDFYKELWEQQVITHSVREHIEELLGLAFMREPIAIRLIGIGIRLNDLDPDKNLLKTKQMSLL